MSEPSQGAPDLETRLAEMDRRLREIQAELAPEHEPSPVAPPDSAELRDEQPDRVRGRSGPLADLLGREPRHDRAPHQVEPPSIQMELLRELYGKLLASVRELLAGYEAAAISMRPSAGGGATAMISAGPLGSTTALRHFAHALSNLPGVREVEVRGYEGPDRAIVDVQLSPENT